MLKSRLQRSFPYSLAPYSLAVAGFVGTREGMPGKERLGRKKERKKEIEK
jgi:hypothetical protein